MSEEFGEKQKEHFDELMNVENERQRRRDGSYIMKCRGLEKSEGSCEDEEQKVVSRCGGVYVEGRGIFLNTVLGE